MNRTAASTQIQPTPGTEMALSLVSDKWTMHVFKALRAGHHRYGQLLRVIPEITRKMLTQTLRKMERDGLITRHDYDTVPPRVEYAISPIGNALLSRLCSLCEWSKAFFEDVATSREAFDARQES